jgi:hypothetical protein
MNICYFNVFVVRINYFKISRGGAECGKHGVEGERVCRELKQLAMVG